MTVRLIDIGKLYKYERARGLTKASWLGSPSQRFLIASISFGGGMFVALRQALCGELLALFHGRKGT